MFNPKDPYHVLNLHEMTIYFHVEKPMRNVIGMGNA